MQKSVFGCKTCQTWQMGSSSRRPHGELDFCYDIQISVWAKQHETFQLCINGSCWCNRVGGNFLAHCTVFYPPSDASLQQDVTNLTLSQTAFLKMKISSLHSNSLQGHQISIKQSTFGTWWSGRWVCDAHRSVWTKMSEEGFHHNRNSWVLFFCFICFSKIGLSVSPKTDFIFWLNSS